MSYYVSQSLIDQVTKLSGFENWHSWKQEILIILQSVDSDGIVCGDEVEPTDRALKQEWMTKNKRAYTTMWACTDPKYRYLYEGSKLGSIIFEKLETIFGRFTFSRRVQLRKSFYGTTHDPSQPIDLYIQAILAGKQRLADIGITVGDTELKDVILMNLDPEFDCIRSKLISRADEPTLEEVKSTLLTSAEAVKIKTEESTLIAKTKWFKSKKKSRTRPPSPVREDDKGYRWCDPTNEDHCHRCGRPGHIAARCITDMPRDIKDWVLGRPTSSKMSADALAAVEKFGRDLWSDL